jgi:hypothetical protein
MRPTIALVFVSIGGLGLSWFLMSLRLWWKRYEREIEDNRTLPPFDKTRIYRTLASRLAISLGVIFVGALMLPLQQAIDRRPESVRLPRDGTTASMYATQFDPESLSLFTGERGVGALDDLRSRLAALRRCEDELSRCGVRTSRRDSEVLVQKVAGEDVEDRFLSSVGWSKARAAAARLLLICEQQAADCDHVAKPDGGP